MALEKLKHENCGLERLMQRTEGEFSGLIWKHWIGDWDQDWLVARKVAVAVETDRNKECTPGLEWAWTGVLGKTERAEKLMGGQRTFLTLTWTEEGT